MQEQAQANVRFIGPDSESVRQHAGSRQLGDIANDISTEISQVNRQPLSSQMVSLIKNQLETLRQATEE